MEVAMARVRSLEPGTQEVRLHPTEVDCFHQTLEAADGTRYLHLTTFGSDSRRSGPKSSQSIQLDEETARALVAVIRETFPSIT
jgi:hypothetical protein